MSIIDMQERPISQSQMERYLEGLVAVNGPGILALVESRSLHNARLGGPTFTQNCLALAAAARKKMKE